MRIGIIGCGNMGGAIARGVVNKGIVEAGSVLLNDKEENKAVSLAKETGSRVESLGSVVRSSDILIIAVKPQDSDVLLQEIAADIDKQTVVSIMAGVRIDRIAGKLGKEAPIARAMPNMAALVNESITCISFNLLVERKEKVKAVFSGIGKVLEVEEGALDAVTALSGSGPAYLFYLADAMMSAGEKNGLGREAVKELVTQTLYGAAILLGRSQSSPGELIEKVASKGGTTEAALSVFNEKNLKAIIERAVDSARKRSEELSKG
ncbi:MAG: pyrroline-5-carboxylate reductase [Candidatus Omnitrophota bacterium]